MAQPIVVIGSPYLGGAELYVARLASELSSQGIELEVWGVLDRLPAAINVPLALGPKWSLRWLPAGLVHARSDLRALRAAVDERGPSNGVFNLHFKREQILFTRMLSDRGRVVWTEHGLFPEGLFGLAIRRRYRRAALAVDTIICVSDRVKSSIDAVLRDDSKTTVVQTRVDAPSPDGAVGLRRRLNIAPGQTVAIVAGRLTRSKRPLLAIQAALMSVDHVIVAGDGPEIVRVRDAYAGDTRVHLLGQVAEMGAVYGAGDVLVFTSDGRGEGMPTVLLEAHACGLAIAATTDCGFEAFVTGSLRGQVAPAQAMKLAGAISAALSQRSGEPPASLGGASEWARDYIRVLLGRGPL